MRHGYYLAESDTLHGDFRLCKDLRPMFLSFGIENPSHYDGISRWIQSNGVMVTRICMRDFFDPKPNKFLIKDFVNV